MRTERKKHNCANLALIWSLQTSAASQAYRNMAETIYQLFSQSQLPLLIVHGCNDASNKLSIQPTAEGSDDPNIVILKTFEEPLRRSPVSPSTRSVPLFAPSSSQPATAPETPAKIIDASVHGNETSFSKLDQARSGGRDAHLLVHYRSNISQRVIKVGSHEVEEDAFEIQARTFPPVSFFFLVICYLSIAVDFI
jgi:hypothetical protein